MTSQPLDLADLRAKAEAATPGPWETNDPGIVIFPEWGGWLAEEDTENQEADAAYIAAASPATILALLDELSEAKARLAEVASLDPWYLLDRALTKSKLTFRHHPTPQASGQVIASTEAWKMLRKAFPAALVASPDPEGPSDPNGWTEPVTIEYDPVPPPTHVWPHAYKCVVKECPGYVLGDQEGPSDDVAR